MLKWQVVAIMTWQPDGTVKILKRELRLWAQRLHWVAKNQCQGSWCYVDRRN